MKWNNIELEVGMSVELVSFEPHNRPFNYNDVGDMDDYSGKVVTISEIKTNSGIFRVEEDTREAITGHRGYKWNFKPTNIASVGMIYDLEKYESEKFEHQPLTSS